MNAMELSNLTFNNVYFNTDETIKLDTYDMIKKETILRFYFSVNNYSFFLTLEKNINNWEMKNIKHESKSFLSNKGSSFCPFCQKRGRVFSKCDILTKEIDYIYKKIITYPSIRLRILKYNL